MNENLGEVATMHPANTKPHTAHDNPLTVEDGKLKPIVNPSSLTEKRRRIFRELGRFSCGQIMSL